MYSFFYDETEHSRKINYQTVTANNYYDNFTSVIVGWLSENDADITRRYLDFEAKYDYRKVEGELKSQTMKAKDFGFGFASLNKHTIGFYDDLLSLYDEKIILYFSVASKIEHIINQLFVNYHNTMFIDIDSMKYSIIKAINVYRPQGAIAAIYKDPQVFVDEIKIFLRNRLDQNEANIVLKEHENQAFEQILLLLDDVEVPRTLDWSYFISFDGFKKLLTEMNVEDYELTIDREGEESRTLLSAEYIGLDNVSEGDSKKYVGIRMADMLAGLISRFMQSLSCALRADTKSDEIKKTLLETGWFAVNQGQLNLYKKLYQIICENNDYWYKSYAGIYSDDLVSFIAFLQFMNHFESAEQIRNERFEMQPEYYNAFVCESLQRRYNIMRNKLPIDAITDDGEDFFLNQRGAKVYWDIERQAMLPIHAGKNKYYVLSVGNSQNGTPLVTILKNDEPICYRLPDAYKEWSMTMVGLANLGETLFPEEVVFTLLNGSYYVDIL